MTLKIIKITLVILASIAITYWILYLIYGSVELKVLYYKLIEPSMKANSV